MSKKTWDDYLLNGKLFVTQKQYDALLKAARADDIPRIDKPLAPLLGGIPVVLVRPGQPVEVGDGSTVAVVGDDLYVFPTGLGEFNA